MLRLLFAWMGAPEDLSVAPKPMPSLPRPLRRSVLERLESFEPEALLADMRRYPEWWKRVGEKLHPFEYVRRYPSTGTAFAVIRRTRVDEKLAMTARGPVTVTWERVRARTWGTLVEEALDRGELEIALRLVAQRPEELARRFDHLLRRAVVERPGALPGEGEATRNLRPLAPAVLDALRVAAPKLPEPLVLTLLEHLRSRVEPAAPRRVFLPRGAGNRAYATADTRVKLPRAAVDEAVALLEAELHRRREERPAQGV